MVRHCDEKRAGQKYGIKRSDEVCGGRHYREDERSKVKTIRT